MTIAIARRRARIVGRLARAQAELTALQEECAHPSATRTAGSNTGNYDPSSDWYWYDYTCPDCGRRWTTEQ